MDELRVCPKCKKLKLLTEFHKHKGLKNLGFVQVWCKSCKADYAKADYLIKKDIMLERCAKNRIKKRLLLMIKLGKKCIKCGEIRVFLLQFDHVNNDGGKERKEDKERGMSLTVMNEYLNGTRDIKRLQLMCANCNFEKQYVSERLLKYIEEVKQFVGYDKEGGISG